MKATITGTSKILLFSAVAVFLIASSMIYSFALGGTPVPPSSFYGTLTIDGSPAPSGTDIKGYVNGEERTYAPYQTHESGQYGSPTQQFPQFLVDCMAGEEIVFSVNTQAGFRNASQPGPCPQGGEVNIDLTVTTGGSPVCGNNIVEQGEDCDPGPDVPGDCCSAGCAFETDSYVCRAAAGDCDMAESCTGQSADCPADEKAPLSTPCDDGLFCSETDHCDGDGNCVQLTARDCSQYNLPPIATCLNIPDSNPFTWDSAPGFTSVCNEITDSCTTGSQTITSACSKASCQAPCETAGDCNDGNSSTIDSCLANCTCQHIYQPSPPVCGNDIVETGETCELPSTGDNPFCGQSTSQCLGTKLGTRDAFGNCNDACGCVDDPFTYECVQGECGAECSFNSDCDDGNASTVDTCFGDCMCEHTPETEYCLLITGMRVLNSMQDEDYTIPAGTMYYIEMSTYNNCDYDIQSMQIVQLLKGAMPVNLGSVDSTIHAAEMSVVTVGFIMPLGTVPGTGFTANGFNWNHWIDQSPGTFQILSDTSQVGFQSQ